MISRATRSAAALVAFAFLVTVGTGQSYSAEQLPWGKTTTSPRVVTPSTTYDPGAAEPSQDYDTSSGDYNNDDFNTSGTGNADAFDNAENARRRRSTDRYQSDPDYSTYRPATPDQEWSDEDDGLYNEQPVRRRTYRPGIPANAPDTPSESRFAGTFSAEEIIRAGHQGFGQVARGFANVVEYAFRKQGRPNGYIIGQEAGGAIVAGLRYGEGILYTKHGGTQTVYWQGPSVGYDFGAEGSKTLILVYDMKRPSDVYGRFGGVDGSAYLVGGVGVTFQQKGHVTMAPIRSGVGLRLGANIGYLKYSRVPTWNPF